MGGISGGTQFGAQPGGTFGSGAGTFGSGSGGFMSGSGGFSAGGLGGGMAVAANDPYANVDLDLSKVKKVEIPKKPFEKKSEEEKVEDKKSLTSKSSLKTTAADHEKAKDSKKEVKFGKSITYQVEGGDEPSLLTEKGDRKIIDEKDLSDGRDEKERIKAMMELEEAKQLEELKAMNEWKAKQAAKN